MPTAKPEALEPAAPAAAKPLKLPTYEVGGKEATRKAYGDALVAVGANRPDLVALDSEVSNSTFAEEFKKAYPDRFFEMFIAEQQLVSAAVGLAVLGKRVVASTFAAFFTRALRPDPHGRASRTPPFIWSARTAGSASARTARRRWASKTSR